MRPPFRALLVSTAALGAMLACAGPAEVPAAPEPVVPAPVVDEPPENPLMMGRKYWFDSDAAPKPIWELDETLTFRKDGTCTLLWESTYDCTWEAKEADGVWRVELTAFTGARDPGGNPHEPSDVVPGARYTVSADGERLDGVGKEEGKRFVLVDEEPGRERGEKGKGRGRGGRGR